MVVAIPEGYGAGYWGPQTYSADRDAVYCRVFRILRVPLERLTKSPQYLSFRAAKLLYFSGSCLETEVPDNVNIKNFDQSTSIIY
jgi:hypothetical protein